MQLKMDVKVKKNVAHIKQLVMSETKFIGGLFSMLSLPRRIDDDDNADAYVYVNEKKQPAEKPVTKRAKSIIELQEKLKKIQNKNDYSVKSKLLKKSISKKLKKKERQQALKKQKKRLKVTSVADSIQKTGAVDPSPDKTALVTSVKPVFNSGGKLVFSKFDFSGTGAGNEKRHKSDKKDPKKILENLKKEEESVKELKESGDVQKAVERKEKAMWKNVLAKAEGDKVKDDPILLKKSLQKKAHKKNTSKKKWEERQQTVEKSKDDKQKKRQKNISKRKQDKKAKKMKKAVKKGCVISGV